MSKEVIPTQEQIDEVLKAYREKKELARDFMIRTGMSGRIFKKIKDSLKLGIWPKVYRRDYNHIVHHVTKEKQKVDAQRKGVEIAFQTVQSLIKVKL